MDSVIKSVFTVGLLSICLSTVPAHAVTLVNGSFETGTNAPTGTFTTLSNPNSDIDGWDVVGGSVDWIRTYWQASDGLRSLDLNGLSAGTIEQSITDLTIGTTYRVSFDMAGNTDGAPTTKTLIAAAIDNNQFTFDTTGQSIPTNMGWVTKYFDFTATGTTQLLRFISQDSGAYGAALDNVRISPVPLPAALPLMLSGLGALGFAGWRRKKAVAT